MSAEDFTIVFLLFAFMAFGAKRLLLYLHALQQDDYSNRRLLDWILKKGVFDKHLTFRVFVIGVFYHAASLPAWFIHMLLGAAYLWVAFKEQDPRRSAKKKLVMTSRAKRIYVPSMMVLVASGLWCFVHESPWVWMLNVQFVPFALMIGSLLVEPYERYIQNKFWNEAHVKLQKLHPFIIGVTGSFGKTSVKHILGHILKSHAPTLVTPGSVNTPMGITRIIREQLDETHKYFIVEMGAYGKESIAKLCRLAPPNMGIISAIGHAHYERFKTLDTVAEAKFELAQAVIDKGGKMVVQASAVQFPYSKNFYEAHQNNFVVCGKDLAISSMEQNEDGLKMALSWKGNSYNLSVPLYGLHHGENVALCFAAAMEMGLAAEDVITALKSVPQITHRLEVKRQPDNTIVIDDAFNSNPAGFKAALDLLKVLKKDGRAILITPGMVELGDAHAEEHEKIGRYAGEICDVCIVVAPARIRSFIRGFKEAGPEKHLIEVKTFEEASVILGNNRKSGDVILLENDLPDLYERVPKL